MFCDLENVQIFLPSDYEGLQTCPCWLGSPMDSQWLVAKFPLIRAFYFARPFCTHLFPKPALQNNRFPSYGISSCNGHEMRTECLDFGLENPTKPQTHMVQFVPRSYIQSEHDPNTPVSAPHPKDSRRSAGRGVTTEIRLGGRAELTTMKTTRARLPAQAAWLPVSHRYDLRAASDYTPTTLAPYIQCTMEAYFW